MAIGEIEYHIPLKDEMNEFNSFYGYLQKVERRKVSTTNEQLKKLIDMYSGKQTYAGILFDNFLIFQTNEEVRT